jgi:hypothetical protein
MNEKIEIKKNCKYLMACYNYNRYGCQIFADMSHCGKDCPFYAPSYILMTTAGTCTTNSDMKGTDDGLVE